eukprot:4982905-Pleurochrysis_carterae.AAC.4
MPFINLVIAVQASFGFVVPARNGHLELIATKQAARHLASQPDLFHLHQSPFPCTQRRPCFCDTRRASRASYLTLQQTGSDSLPELEISVDPMSQPNPVSRRSTRWTGALARREALVLAALLASPLSALAEEDKDTSELRGLLQQLISRFGWSKPAEEPSQPTLFGEPVKARDDLSYTAESMLIRSLPVECPPLDVLTSELEKLYVLRDEDATDVDGYWGVLLASQTEATEAATAARPLFRLFFASSKVGIGMRRRDASLRATARIDVSALVRETLHFRTLLSRQPLVHLRVVRASVRPLV